MRKPTVDYRQLRLSKLTDPQFSHLFLLLGWVGYLILFFLTERLIPAESCVPMHCALDDIIPFCEFFLIPYVGWYLLIVGSLLYFLLYNVENFKRLQTYFMIVQAIAIVIFILFPTRQDLRPTEFPRDNLFTDGVAFLYSIDTNTGVCPSLHCALSIGIASMWLKEPSVGGGFKAFIVIFATLVCLSTVFLKQHSALDFFAALPLCLIAEAITCGGYWKERFKPKARQKA